jgi:uncharacterized membrane protein
MTYLILGLIVFLGVHGFTALRGPRAGVIAAVGEGPYKIGYSLLSLAGFVLLVWGFGQYRAGGMIQLWTPPAWGRHAAMGLMPFAFIALAASGRRPGRIRGWLRHPMLVGIKIWALAHLLANGDLGGVVLFGFFLAWAVFDRIAVKRRGDMGGERLDHFTGADAIVVGAGVVAYTAMLFAHGWLIGVPVLRM